MTASLPHLTAGIEGTGGTIRETPEDFAVEEVPAYLPVGEGAHLFLWVEKRNWTTPEAARAIAEALGVDPTHVGWAGLKDRHAVTRQWLSLPAADPDRARHLEIDGIRVLKAALHGNKLRPGHLKGNRFVIRIRRVARPEAASPVLDVLQRSGVPNYFGSQRFGRGGDNIPRAQRWLIENGRAPRSRFERKLLVSALQAAVFNEAAAARVLDGTLATPVAGDLLRREDSGGLFVTPDTDEATERMSRWEISATGPLFGDRMPSPEGTALGRERELFERWRLTDDLLRSIRRLGRGARRPYRVRPQNVSVASEGDGLQTEFTLPAGAYATVVLREIMKDARS